MSDSSTAVCVYSLGSSGGSCPASSRCLWCASVLSDSTAALRTCLRTSTQCEASARPTERAAQQNPDVLSPTIFAHYQAANIRLCEMN